jgi:antimicrobial peptide system SdpA family protein
VGIRSFVMTSLILAVVFVASVFAVLPRNVLSSSESDAVGGVVARFWPQGWGFFTNAPDGAGIAVYDLSPDGGLDSLLATPQGRSSNLFGLSRTARAQGPEIALVASRIRDSNWIKCDVSISRCINSVRSNRPRRVQNAAPDPTLCGRLVLVQEKPTPWAYRDLVTDRFRAIKAAVLQVDCNTKERR